MNLPCLAKQALAATNSIFNFLSRLHRKHKSHNTQKPSWIICKSAPHCAKVVINSEDQNCSQVCSRARNERGNISCVCMGPL
jgi:hypothetical protein